MNRQGKRGIRPALVLAGATAVLGMTLAKVAAVRAQQMEPDPAATIQNAAPVANAAFWARWSSVDWQAIARSLASSAQLSLQPAIQTAPEATVVFGQNVFNKDSTVLAQNDTTVVFDPLNVNRVVGAYQDLRGVLLSSTALGGDFTGWSISTNGASPAKDGQLQPAVIAGTKTPSAGFPVLSVDAAGNYFLASVYYDWQHTQLSTLPTGPSGLAIARSPKPGPHRGYSPQPVLAATPTSIAGPRLRSPRLKAARAPAVTLTTNRTSRSIIQAPSPRAASMWSGPNSPVALRTTISRFSPSSAPMI